jgi:hypothetical protein
MATSSLIPRPCSGEGRGGPSVRAAAPPVFSQSEKACAARGREAHCWAWDSGLIHPPPNAALKGKASVVIDAIASLQNAQLTYICSSTLPTTSFLFMIDVAWLLMRDWKVLFRVQRASWKQRRLEWRRRLTINVHEPSATGAATKAFGGARRSMCACSIFPCVPRNVSCVRCTVSIASKLSGGRDLGGNKNQSSFCCRRTHTRGASNSPPVGPGRGADPVRKRSVPSGSPHERANNSDGFDDAADMRRLRSVLHHPAGLPLAWFLHGRPERDGGPVARAGMEHYFAEFSMPPRLDAATAESDDVQPYGGVFGASYDAWLNLPAKRRTEPMLSDLLRGSIRALLRGEHHPDLSTLCVIPEKRIPDPPTGSHSGRADILISATAAAPASEGDAAKKGSVPRLLVEIGLQNDAWWQKAHQGSMYIGGLDDFTEAMMFAVVTVETATKVRRSATGGLGSARVAAFLATPNKPKSGNAPADFRMSLLWHTETSDVRELSSGFGRILYAAVRLLPDWLRASHRVLESRKFQYLGPNCSKIMDKVRGNRDRSSFHCIRNGTHG